MKQTRFERFFAWVLLFAFYCSGTSCSAEQQGSRTGFYTQAGSIPESVQEPDAANILTGGTTGIGIPSDLGNPSIGDSSLSDSTVLSNSDDVCDVIRLEASRVKADLMVVLDRSGSMGDEFRWEPSVAAVRSVTQELDSCIRLGLTLFPSDKTTTVDFFGVPVEVAESCAPGEVAAPIADANGANISSILDMSSPEGGTPTSETLQVVLESFTDQTIVDTDSYSQYVLLVTDGQPTCPAGNGSDVTQQDIDASYAAMDALTAFGAKSYVIGYDTTGEGRESLASVLDGLAQRGGTGDTTHRPVEDEQSLIAELQAITGDIISCDLLLNGEPPGPEYVRVRVDGEQINLDQPDGWEFIPPNIVRLVGNACANIKDCYQHFLEVDVLCEPLIVV